MQQLDPLSLFDPAKPFHPLVVNYLALLVGFRKLFHRGTGLILADDFAIHAREYHSTHVSMTLDASMGVQLDPDDTMWPEPFDPLLPDEFNERIRRDRAWIGRNLRYAHADLDYGIILESKSHDVEFRSTIDDVARVVPQGGLELGDLRNRSGGILLVLAHEATKTLGLKTPAWEFLRHCRNGIGHGGALSFQGDEPRRAAEWRGITLDRSMHGTPLFRLPGRNGLLDDGDPILLLWDLEQSTPSIPRSSP